MKNTRLLQLFLYSCIIVLLVSSCEEEPKEQKEQPVQFTFNGQEPDENGRLAELSDARAVVISVVNSSGETVLNMEKLDVFKLDGTYTYDKFISKPVSLTPGNYELTDFLVVDEDNNVIYVAPKEGSDNAQLVNNPLPIEFSVTANELNEFSIAVVDATSDPVESYGYTTFSLHAVNTLSFRIQPFITEYEFSAYEYIPSLALTDAHIEVRRSCCTDVLYEGMLTPENNLVEIPVRYGSSYDIIITKDFYKPYEKTFTRQELIDTEGDPIEVILESKTDFMPILSTGETIKSTLIPPGDHSKFLYTTDDGLYKINISNLNNSGAPVFVAPYTGYLQVDFFGDIRVGDYVSKDQGNTWTADPQTGPRTFAEIDGTYYGRIGSELYSKSGGGDWQFLSELAPYTDIVAHEGRLYTAPEDIYSDNFYVSDDGINFQVVPADVVDVGNRLFTEAGRLFLNSSFEGGGFIIPWDGSSWDINNSIYEWDPQISSFVFIKEYKNNLIVVDDGLVKVIRLDNCSPGSCEAQLINTYVSDYRINAFPIIYGNELRGDLLILKTVADDNGDTHLYAMDLSGLELE